MDAAWLHPSVDAAVIILRGKLAQSSIWAGGIAIVISGAALVLCHSRGVKSRISQDMLITSFTLCQRVLPFIMVSQIVFCGLGVVLLALSEVVWFITHFSINGGSFKVLIIVLCAIGSVLWMLVKSLASIKKCFALFKPEDHPIRGSNVTQSQAPELWQWVKELAQRGAVTVPDNIVVGFFDCFYVTANAVQIVDGPRLTGNTLYFPLTYSSLMDKEEMASVIGHELGHFTGMDTQYSLKFAPLYAGLYNSLNQLMSHSPGVSYIDRVVLYPALCVGCSFLTRFHEAVSHWSRSREYAADETGARVGTPQALASALLRVSALSEIIDRHVETLFDEKQPTDDWIASLFRVAQKSDTLDISACLENVSQHPTDSHPVTRSRIEALGVPLDDTLLSRASRRVNESDYQAATQLFSAQQTLSVAMTQEIAQEVNQLREQYHKEMVEQAQQATESLTFYGAETAVWMWGAGLGIMSLATGLMIVGLMFVDSKPVPAGIITIALGLIAFGLVCGFIGWVSFRNRNKALFSLTEKDLTSVDLTRPVLLTDIEACEVVEKGGGPFHIYFYWRDGSPAPELSPTRSAFSDVDISVEERRVSISVTGYLRKQVGKKTVSMNASQARELLDQYFRSAYARKEINEG
ncbi:M48 family metallopeptidase [Superficieibacter sp.]|uniref:M48 family metallopeptidase n=1 Tax=Superficieibacter sp. TaxID=2303322 RepID=UPI0028A8B96B|nr:M48 family metallopeptidase [Superficieibacter sp.]